MKNISFILILSATTFFMLIAMLIASCKKDANGASILVGNWKYIPTASYAINTAGTQPPRYLKFNADGTVDGDFFSFTNYNLKDSLVTLSAANSTAMKYVYKIKQDTLMLTTPGLCLDDCTVIFVKQY